MTLISYMIVVDFCCSCLPVSISPSFFFWGAISSPELRLWALDRAHFTPGSKDRYVIHVLLTKVLHSSDHGDWLRNGHQPQFGSMTLVLDQFFRENKYSLFKLEGCKTGVLRRSSAWEWSQNRWRATRSFELLKSVELKTWTFQICELVNYIFA